MYGIFTYIYHTNQPNVGKYTIHGWYGVLGSCTVMLVLDFAKPLVVYLVAGGCGTPKLTQNCRNWNRPPITSSSLCRGSHSHTCSPCERTLLVPVSHPSYWFSTTNPKQRKAIKWLYNPKRTTVVELISEQSCAHPHWKKTIVTYENLYR